MAFGKKKVTSSAPTKPMAPPKPSRVGTLKRKILSPKNPTKQVSVPDKLEVDIMGNPLKPMLLNGEIGTLTPPIPAKPKQGMLTRAKSLLSHKPKP